MMKKILLIAKILYLRYFILFMFDNITGYLVYAQNILYIIFK